MNIITHERQFSEYDARNINVFLLIEQIKTKQRRHYFCTTRYKKQHELKHKSNCTTDGGEGRERKAK